MTAVLLGVIRGDASTLVGGAQPGQVTLYRPLGVATSAPVTTRLSRLLRSSPQSYSEAASSVKPVVLSCVDACGELMPGPIIADDGERCGLAPVRD